VARSFSLFCLLLRRLWICGPIVMWIGMVILMIGNSLPGDVFFLVNLPISWKSKKQDVTS